VGNPKLGLKLPKLE